jgi:hypothetical protein
MKYICLVHCHELIKNDAARGKSRESLARAVERTCPTPTDDHDHTTSSITSICFVQLMHFAKTYASQLESLPPDLRRDVIEYRTLKKLIRQVVDELGAVGLSPDVLQSVCLRSSSEHGSSHAFQDDLEALGEGQNLAELLRPDADEHTPVEVVYEFHTHMDGTLEPRIRICIGTSSDADALTDGRTTPEFVVTTSWLWYTNHDSQAIHIVKTRIRTSNLIGDRILLSPVDGALRAVDSARHSASILP